MPMIQTGYWTQHHYLVEQFVNAPTTQLSIEPVHQRFLPTIQYALQISLNGYAGDYRYEQTLIHPMECTNFMEKRRLEVFYPGLYQVETKVTDRFGRTTIVLQDLTVVRSLWLLLIL